jgi:type IV pilus assembly protein PilB
LCTAQRLARRLCPECKIPTEPEDIDHDKLIDMGFRAEELEGATIMQPVGCPRCRKGYKGRAAIVETLRVTEGVKRMIIQSKTSLDIKEFALTQEDMVTLRRACCLRVLRGDTSLEELERITMKD